MLVPHVRFLQRADGTNPATRYDESAIPMLPDAVGEDDRGRVLSVRSDRSRRRTLLQERTGQDSAGAGPRNRADSWIRPTVGRAGYRARAGHRTHQPRTD